MKYATLLMPECRADNDRLEKSIIINEEFKDAYKLLYEREKEVTANLEAGQALLKVAHEDCKADNMTCNQYVDQLESKLKNSRTENWIWRGVALLSTVVIIRTAVQ